MIKRPLLLLVVIAVVLVVIFVFTSMNRSGGEDLAFPKFDRQRAAKIIIEGKEKITVLEKQGDQWIVASEHSLPVEQGAADRILDLVTKISRKDIVSTNPAKRSIYQVDSSGVLVRIEDENGKDIASFVVGKTGPDYQSTYIGGTSSDEVILFPQYLHPIIERGKRPWEDLALWRYDAGAINEIEIVRPEGRIVVSRNSAGNWYLSEPESMECDNDRVSRVVRTLCYLRADEIVGRKSTGGLDFSGADSSAGFKLLDGSFERLLIGRVDEKNNVLATVEGRDAIYAIPEHKIKTIMPHLAELLIKPGSQEKGK